MRFKAFCIIPHPGEIEIKPLVLCKECRHYDGEGTCMKIGIVVRFPELDGEWFCADGEKKREGTRRYRCSQFGTITYEGEDDG